MQRPKFVKNCVCLSLALLFMYCAKPAEAFAYHDRIGMAKSLAHYAMGQIYDLLGLTQRSVLEYEKASQYDESSYLLHLRLGSGYARLDILDKAEEELKLVQKYNSEDLQSHYLLALIYSNQREYDKAAGEYEHILKTFSDAEPQNVEIYTYLGQLYYSQKKYNEAIAQYEKILALEEKNPDVMYALGTLYWDAQQREKAFNVLTRAIEIDPDHDGCLNTLAYFYAEHSQNLDKALELILRALEISPDNGGYLDSLGWVYYKKEMYKEALAAFERADSLMKDPVIYDHMGDAYLKLNQASNAVKYWNKSLELLPDQKMVLQKISEVQNTQVNAEQTRK